MSQMRRWAWASGLAGAGLTQWASPVDAATMPHGPLEVARAGPSLAGAVVMGVVIGVLALLAIGFLVRTFARHRALRRIRHGFVPSPATPEPEVEPAG
jgi:hypothetical protein